MDVFVYVKDFGIEDDNICEVALQEKKEKINKKLTFKGWKKIVETK